MTRSRSIPARMTGLGLVISVTLGLGGCQTSGSGPSLLGSRSDPLTTGSINAADSRNGQMEQTTDLARKWEANPRDADTALAYAESLQRLGGGDRAVSVLQQAATHNPKDARVLEAYGRALAAAGKAAEASQVIYQAIALGNADWRLYSLQGSLLDRMREHARAQEYYEAALKTAPTQPSLQNNLAMSYALGGNPEKAETVLRGALARGPAPQAKTQMTQNLALVLGLQGKFDEARTVLAEELPPEQVEANIAYMRQMVSQPNTWQQLQDLDNG